MMQTADYGMRTAKAGIRTWLDAFGQYHQSLKDRGKVIPGDGNDGDRYQNLNPQELGAAASLLEEGWGIMDYVRNCRVDSPLTFGQMTACMDDLLAMQLPAKATGLPGWRSYDHLRRNTGGYGAGRDSTQEAYAASPDGTGGRGGRRASNRESWMQEISRRAEELSRRIMFGLPADEVPGAVRKLIGYIGPEETDYVLEIVRIGMDERKRMENERLTECHGN